MPEKSNGFVSFKVIAAIVVVVIILVLVILHHKRSEPLNYNTTAVGRGEITQTVTATGTLNPVKSVQVGCQVSGRISEIYVDYNSTVTNGQLIAQIDPRSYEQQVASADADLANALANYELQSVQARREADLYTNKLVSGSDYDIAVATLHQSEATVKIKRASLENTRTSLGYTKIVSPVDGTVISRAVDVGQTVAASFNTPTLFLIANDLTSMQIDAAVAEADVGGVLEGQNVDFTVDAYPTRTFHGEVFQVRNSPSTINNVVTYDAVISVTNADSKLKPGMTANVSIVVATRPDTLKVPNAALRFRPPENASVLTNAVAEASAAPTSPPAITPPAGGGAGEGRQRGGRGGGGGGPRVKGPRNARMVYVLAEGSTSKLKQVPVKVGITDGIFTEITDGLQEGDKVVTSVVSTDSTAAAGPASPFGGGGFGPRR